MRRIGRKIRELCKEFVGLQEVIEQVTIEPRKSFRRPVTEIRVKRIDGNLLRRVLECSWSGGACYDHKIEQKLFVGGTEVSIRTKGSNHSMAAHAVRQEWGGEEVREALRRMDLSKASFLVVVEFERYSDEHNHREYNRVTVYKASKGWTIEADVAWEFAFPTQTAEEVEAEVAAAYKQMEDEQNAEIDAALEQERCDSGYYDDDGYEEDPPEPTEVLLGDPGGGGLVIFE